MSKSLGNAINLDSTTAEVMEKIRKAKTDPSRIHKNDLGHPDICPVYNFHCAFNSAGAQEIYTNCSAGTIGCTDCKSIIILSMNELLDPIRERRAGYVQKPKLIDEILVSGTEKARAIAKATMLEVRDAMGINYFT